MDWNKDLAADLPAPRDDEPQSLRDDIVAELQDHLACALHRERHATGDEDRAQKNVIEKFGNPAAIAYRLWWDAMKEKIMSQRILIGTVLLLAIACLAATGFAWIAVQEGREVNQLVMANSQSMMETNRTMMEKLSELATAPRMAPAVDSKQPSLTNDGNKPQLDLAKWVPLKIELVKSEKDGPPAVGYEVQVIGKFFGDEQHSITKTSDKNGVADFNVVHPGMYYGYIKTPWDEDRRITFYVYPNQPHTEKYVCPAEAIPEATLSIDVNWPDDLRDRQLNLICLAGHEPRPGNYENWQLDRVVDRLPVGNRSGLLWIKFDEQFAQYPMWYYSKYEPFVDSADKPTAFMMNVIRRADNYSYLLNDEHTIRALPIEISVINVVWPSPETLAKKVGLSYDDDRSMLKSARIATWPLHRQRIESEQQADDALVLKNDEFKEKKWLVPPSEIPDETTDPLRFIPKPGEENVWTIELPESLIARTREALQAIDEFKAEHAAAESAATE